ncbi:dihydroneopterin aldolase [Aestuariirhabdus litorea]|uniref:7,8-dihydroneopterin aldolase n=1 Tax=Aestuariirhabdus litorea TaxID=2528527 RepID=A0A3P3VRB5_9GAMM|nr:dihydroneopterin aldolase [Aestuariirhabdus litorea]RRJ83363.1 dihydroneopterin aldolase [Aestuariirhabdus litorea]RWW93522.1 dihydroneopterin aldolase [Endozoicomonadaceae bacterium GTF-13]
MDRVRIEELAVEVVIGVYDWEREQTQPLLLDLWLETDFSAAFASDALEDALNYADIAERVRAFCEASRYQLLETLAGAVLRLLLEQYNASRAGVRIRKPRAIAPAMAVIECERGRDFLE